LNLKKNPYGGTDMAKILVVDDEATIATQLEERLNHLGYEVAGCASSGEEAVKLAKKMKPDLVLMDIVMPGRMDGIEAAARIKQDADIPVIFLTAYGDDHFIKRAKRAAPFGYILKPFQEAELKANVELALSNQRIRKEIINLEQRWRSIAENIDDAVILSDKQGRITFWNRGAEGIFGYTSPEILGKPLSMILSEGFREKFEKIYPQLFYEPQSEMPAKKLEMIGLRKDYDKFPLEISLKPQIRKKENFIISLARDVTDVKKIEDGIKTSLKEAEMKMGEIRNRVKDNLGIIYSLLDLQDECGKETEPGTVYQLDDKISLMDKAGKIDFEEYMENLGRRLFQTFKVEPGRIDFLVKAGGIRLDIQSAVYCGLIASELISNAIKYAFPKEKRGRIIFSFNENEDGRCCMTVQDNGVGFPQDFDTQAPETLCFQVINSLIEQIGGEIVLDRRSGTKFDVIFPKSGEKICED
jgi:PAS domain S-box-containing protein